MTTVRTHSAHRTGQLSLGPHSAKPTSIDGAQTEAARSVWSNSRIDTGLWECTPGVFTATREGYTEICTILSGRVVIEVEGSEAEEFGPGDVMIMPSGWAGTWRVLEPLRKHYTTVSDT